MLSSFTTTIDGECYTSGILARNNPSGLVMEELESDTWPSPLRDVVDEIDCFVSIGTGRPTLREPKDALWKRSTLKGAMAVRDALSICSQVTTDSHTEHMKVFKRYVPLFTVFTDDNAAAYTFSVSRKLGRMTSTSDSTLIPVTSPNC